MGTLPVFTSKLVIKKTDLNKILRGFWNVTAGTCVKLLLESPLLLLPSKCTGQR